MLFGKRLYTFKEIEWRNKINMVRSNAYENLYHSITTFGREPRSCACSARRQGFKAIINHHLLPYKTGGWIMKRKIVSYVLFIAALAFIIIGILQDDYMDTLFNATMICLGCIGIG